MNKITPFLWFDNNAEEAVDFYSAAFGNTKVKATTRYSEESAKASGRPKDSIMTVAFEIFGQPFTAINGGPVFKFNPSISFFFYSKDENEINELWEKLSKEGKALMDLDKYDWSKKYGWVQDKYGLSWQIMLVENDIEQKLVPSFLFVDKLYGKAEEAINFYLSVFKNGKAGNIFKYGNDNNNNENAIMYGDFIIEGNIFAAMDGAGEHNFTFNEAVSFVVNCENQKELDYFWDKLSEGGDVKAQQCGWLKDKFGVSWQIVPKNLGELLNSKEPGKSQRVMKKLLQMKKLDIDTLKNA